MSVYGDVLCIIDIADCHVRLLLLFVQKKKKKNACSLNILTPMLHTQQQLFEVKKKVLL